ncbi:MAG: DUF2585 family protein [Planctomycetota bacterium]
MSDSSLNETNGLNETKDDAVRRGFVYCLVVAGMTAITLGSMGRIWWCACGSLNLASWDIWSTHNSQHLIDPYTFSHVLHGVIFYWLLQLVPDRYIGHRRFLVAITIEACWELLENSPIIIDRYRAATISLDYYGDSIANSFFDIIACGLGYWFARSFRWTWSVSAIVATEIVMLITIRDSLVLNVVMLLTPIDAIREWQAG